RGRSWRKGSTQAAAGVRGPHAAASAHRHLLRTRREGERDLLRTEAGREAAVDQKRLDLRLPHQQGVYAEGTAHGPYGPRRICRVLPPGESPPAQAEVGREEEP